MPSLSLIIPTYNGADKVGRVLKSVRCQSQMPDEVLVVVDGSTDNTLEVLHVLQSEFNFRIIQRSNGGRSRVRNTGAKEATGDILLFIDDDMELGPECVQTHRHHHERHVGSILTGSQIIPEGTEYSDFQNYRAYLTRQWSDDLNGTGPDAGGARAVDFITAANFSIAKEDFFRLGAFDELLTDGEDFDLSYKARLEGIKMFYNPSAFGLHHDVLTCAKNIKRQRDYRNAGISLAKAYPERYGPLFGDRLKQDRSLKAWFFLFFCFRFWVNAIDAGRFKHWPRSLRYRIYDWVTTANTNFWPERLSF